MAKGKKKLLPKDFEALLKTGDLNALKAVFDSSHVDAVGGYAKKTALAYNECNDELARWLVAEGADIMATDKRGNTPLHSRASNWQGRVDILIELGADVNHGEGANGTPLHMIARHCNLDIARALIDNGANVNALNAAGLPPLAYALHQCSNNNIQGLVPLAKLLLEAGAHQTPDMKEFVTRIGTDFEFHRAGFNAESVDAVSDVLDELYTLFDVAPVPRRAMHDGVSPIKVVTGSWEERHQALWELLVPSSGAAQTVQGEVIRISGKIHRELEGNGGVNWNSEFRKLSSAFLTHIRSGIPLPEDVLTEADAVIKEINGRGGDPRKMGQWAVEWVALNPKPAKLSPPDYKI